MRRSAKSLSKRPRRKSSNAAKRRLQIQSRNTLVMNKKVTTMHNPAIVPPLAPPHIASSDLELSISITKGRRRGGVESRVGGDDDNKVSSVMVPDQALHELLERGSTVVPLAQGGISVGDFPKFLRSDNVCLNANDIPDFDDWKAAMHLKRRDNQRSCCVHDSAETWAYFRDVIPENQPSCRKLSVGSLRFSPGITPLAFTEEGLELEQRIFSFHRQALEGIYLEVTLLADLDDSPNHPDKCRLTFTHAKVEIWCLWEHDAGRVFDSRVESRKHGVKALHFLQSLRALADDSDCRGETGHQNQQ